MLRPRCSARARLRARTGTQPTDRRHTPDAALPSPPAAAPRAPADEGDEIVVTATKRAENLQDVPIAITALRHQDARRQPGQRVRRLCQVVPSLSYKTAGPGSANVYFRGVASGENANHSASLPSVGTYLDEQPITTIQGALDIHVFDIARVEALAGPQGTLYGASSQAGTIRIITNKPDPSGTYGEVDLEVNKSPMATGAIPAKASSTCRSATSIAARVVGWYRRDGGYIDNIPGTPAPIRRARDYHQQ